MPCVVADRLMLTPSTRQLAGIALVLTTLYSPAARAQPLTLTWDAPDSCPSQSDVQALIETIENTSASPARVHVLVRQDDKGTWWADITMQDARGKAWRSLRGESCRAVAEATAVILGLAMDKTIPPPSPRPAPEPAPSPPAAPVVSKPQFGAWMAGLVDIGTLPSVGTGLTAGFSFRLAATRIGIEGHWLTPRTAVVDARPSEGAEFWMVRFGLRGCQEFEPNSDISAGPCVTAGYERLTGEGFGSDRPARATFESLSLGAGGVFLLHFTRSSALRLSVDLTFSVRQPTFMVDGVDEVHRPAPAMLRMSLGPELRF